MYNVCGLWDTLVTGYEYEYDEPQQFCLMPSHCEQRGSKCLQPCAHWRPVALGTKIMLSMKMMVRLTCLRSWHVEIDGCYSKSEIFSTNNCLMKIPYPSYIKYITVTFTAICHRNRRLSKPRKHHNALRTSRTQETPVI